MSRSPLILAVILVSCSKPTKEVVYTKPIRQPQYPTVTVVTQEVIKPTPTPVAGWIGIQESRWNRAAIRPEKVHFAQVLSDTIQMNKTRYSAVQSVTGVPWPVIGSIHSLECSGNFRQHIHNGDPITAKTRHIPANRPNPWLPPSDWESSAVDAVRYDKLDRKQWVGIGNELQNIEGYNGTGYQRYHSNVPSPYLWSWTNIYSRGKYIADGTWSDTAISGQCGVVPLLKTLK